MRSPSTRRIRGCSRVACREDVRDVASRVGAAGVDDARAGVPALAAESPSSKRTPSSPQPRDARGGLLGQQLDRARPADAPACGERVGGVERGVVAWADRRRDAALRGVAVRAAVRGLREHDHRGACVGRREGCGEAGDAGSDDGDVACRGVFASQAITSAPECTRLPTPRRKLRRMRCSRPCSRCGTGGFRRCSGSARGSRTQRAWALPGGALAADETLEESMRRHLAEKVDVRELSHLEQLETLSDPERNPARRELATGVSRPRAGGRRPAGPGGHALASGRRAPRARVRPRGDPPQRARAAAREALVHEPRLRARAAELHARRAARSLRRRARSSRHRDESPARPAPAPPAARTPASGGTTASGGGRPAAIYRFRNSRAGDHRSVRRPSAAYNGSLSWPSRTRRHSCSIDGGRTTGRRSRSSSASSRRRSSRRRSS